MHYLRDGLAELGLGPGSARFLAVFFALMCIGGSFGGGNMFQANQSFAQVAAQLPFLERHGRRRHPFGLLLAGLVGFVIIGGIKRIGEVAGFLVPIMCGVYVVSGLLILLIERTHGAQRRSAPSWSARSASRRASADFRVC